jgi:ParB family chromosome partitioning protein
MNSSNQIKTSQQNDLHEIRDQSDNKQCDSIQSISLDTLYPFQNHPFKRYSDDKMHEMVDSIRDNGVLMPILLRPRNNGDGYEIISGHNRVEAAKEAGLTEIPSFIKEMDDETATIAMIDSNLSQREKLLPSEKAFAYKMKLDAIKRQGERTDLTSAQVGPRLAKIPAREIIGEALGESKNQVSRFIRLTELVPQLLDLVDESKFAFNPAVAVSYLNEEQQYWLYEIMCIQQCSPSLSHADRLKKLSQQGRLDRTAMDAIMLEPKPQCSQIIIKQQKIAKYFSKDATPQQIEETIIRLLDNWYRKRNQEQQR